MIKELLNIAYKRELELEELIETTNSHNKWFFKETKTLNIQIQTACLDKMDRQRRIKEHKESLH